MATDDHNPELLKLRIGQLEAEFDEHKRRAELLRSDLNYLRNVLEERRRSPLEDRYLTSRAFAFLGAVLALVLVSQVLHYFLEVRRLNTAPSLPAQMPAVSSAPPQAPTSPTARNAQPEPDAETRQATRTVIERFIDQSKGSGAASSLATVSLSALASFIGTLEKGGAIAAETASSILKDLGREAGSATVEVSKDAAKAVIARYLGPKADTGASAALPGHVVLVNVHTGERPATARGSRKTGTPPVASCSTLPANVAKPAATSG